MFALSPVRGWLVWRYRASVMAMLIMPAAAMGFMVALIR
jgi:hypothetical protein